MSASNSPVILIVGTSSGFGYELCLYALSLGYTVIATSRDTSKISSLASAGAITATLDLRSSDSEVAGVIHSALARTTQKRVDILINNAGYALMGGIDEATQEEVEAIFDTNVFGLLRVLRAVLPIMRKQRSGVVANMGSMAAWTTIPMVGHYCLTKAALASMNEALRAENESFGIECTCLEPGYFQTNIASPDVLVKTQNVLEDLKPISEKMSGVLEGLHGNQPGDTKKGAAVIIDALAKRGPWTGKQLPVRLVVGNDAQEVVSGILERTGTDIKTWRDVTSRTDRNEVLDAPHTKY